MEKTRTNIVAWIAPEQCTLLTDVVQAADLHLLAVGTGNQSAINALATSLKTNSCSDLRTMATQYEDSTLLIAEPGSYDVSLCELLRKRRFPAVTTTPLSGNIDSLVAEAGLPPAAMFVPLMRRSAGFGEALDDIEQFGKPISANCTMLCSPVEGTLWARLFDAMDFINGLFGTPESVHAFYYGGKVPDEPSDLQGHMTVNLQFQQQRCATLHLSDQATWKRNTLMIGDGRTIMIDDGGATPAAAIGKGIVSTLTEQPQTTTADAPSVLALCEAARLSCLTGSLEQPSRVLEMLQ